MTALTDYCARIRAWIDDEDPSDATVTEWIRDAEERMNNELRSTEQVQRVSATFDDDCAPLPLDWLELIYVRLKGGPPFSYITPQEYWAYDHANSRLTLVPDPQEIYPTRRGHYVYTIIGNTLFVKPSIDPNALTQVEICYYRMVAPLGTSADVVLARYPSIYRNCTLAASAPYLVEDERLQTWAALATAGLKQANDASRIARWSGGPLTPVVRSFG
jgi:hypothetical protein